jgi:2-polyprenyl-6-methoxyphenol hydroxylase-like FAD-dependent oxidoreductase
VLIVGGGPAGSLLGCLLARRGIDVVVVEKQSDLERSFRGENIAARSVHTLRELGFGPALDEHGYLEISSVTVLERGRQLLHVDYRKFPLATLPIDIPQPALIGIFQAAAAANPSFTLCMGTSFTGLVEEDGVVRGATVRTRDGRTATVRARLVVGADGRFSKVRQRSGLTADIRPMPRDFLSFKLPRPAGWENEGYLMVDRDRHIVVLPTFPNLLRIGHNLPKRQLGALRAAGLDAFKAGIADLDPRLADLVEEHITSWDDTSFLEIFTAEMDEWARDGLLLIGDAAHTCTPILGQGVNLAIQDAVSLTPVLAAALARDGDRPIRASDLAGFVAARRQHKLLVTRYQRMQESALAMRHPVQLFLRRARFTVLNQLPLKYRLLDRVVNAADPVDPVDLAAAKRAQPTPALSSGGGRHG